MIILNSHILNSQWGDDSGPSDTALCLSEVTGSPLSAGLVQKPPLFFFPLSPHLSLTNVLERSSTATVSTFACLFLYLLLCPFPVALQQKHLDHQSWRAPLQPHPRGPLFQEPGPWMSSLRPSWKLDEPFFNLSLVPPPHQSVPPPHLPSIWLLPSHAASGLCPHQFLAGGDFAIRRCESNLGTLLVVTTPGVTGYWNHT